MMTKGAAIQMAAVILLVDSVHGGVEGPPSPPVPRVRVELLAASGEIPRSGELWLGVRFRIDPGWHIYWLNPGDSGGPPTMQWELPAGYVAEPPEWPAPRRIETPPLVSYGYSGEVVLPVRLRVPEGEERGATDLRAYVRWLVCREVCIVESGRVGLSLPLDESEESRLGEWKAAIDRARSQVPGPPPAYWNAAARFESGRILLFVRTGAAAQPSSFFPLDRAQIDDSAPQEVSTTRDGFQIRLRPSDQLVAPPPRLRGVIALADGRAFVIDAGVTENTK